MSNITIIDYIVLKMVDFKEFDQNGKLHNMTSGYFEFICT